MGRTGALEYNRPGLKVWLSHLLSVFYYLLLFATFSSLSPHHPKTMPDWLLSIIMFIISIVKIWREWCWSKCMDSRTNKALGDFGRSPVFVLVQAAGWLPRWLSAKELACQSKRCGFDSWVEKIPWRRKWQPTPWVCLPGESPWTEELGGYRPWGRKKSDTTLRINHNLRNLQGFLFCKCHQQIIILSKMCTHTLHGSASYTV